MRTEGVEQPIGLMLRIDSSSNTLQFDNMMHQGMVGTEEWQEYMVSLPLPKEAKMIYIGAILRGKGKLWIDDFQVIIDKERKLNYNFGFEYTHNPNNWPNDWRKWGYPSYKMEIDSVVKHSGKYALRVESTNETIAGEFGAPYFPIPAEFEGEKITVKAFMRTEGVDQPIGLLLRIDGEKDHVLQFDNMTHRGITGSAEWQEYSVSLPLPKEAKMIYIGAILSGKGKLWIDDFQLLIDDKDHF
jgi:hypothetical protein